MNRDYDGDDDDVTTTTNTVYIDSANLLSTVAHKLHTQKRNIWFDSFAGPGTRRPDDTTKNLKSVYTRTKMRNTNQN